MQSHLNKMRELAGVITQDWLRYQRCFLGEKDNYLQIRNRLERVASGPENLGYVCLWPYTSRLHAPLILPSLGKRLLEICVTKSKFELCEDKKENSEVQMSVLIGHRGKERLPLLLATIRSIAAQADVNLECIVIEQDKSPIIKEHLPKWVRHIYQETISHGYNRSAAFNFGARYARGSILLLHDNDMLIPNKYCQNIISLVTKGYEAINLKRYVFYLTRSHSEKMLISIDNILTGAPEYIVQNLEAGGSMAITRNAYFAIGGMDEEFIGWGGEDIELWQRCSLLKRWIWGYEPIIHLWHQSQPLKRQKDNPNITRIKILARLSLADRVNFLKTKNWEDGCYD